MFVLFVFANFLSIFACEQRPDWLTIDGFEKVGIYATGAPKNLPLEVYYEKNPTKRPQLEWMDTGCYRAYIANYLLKDGKLYLVGLKDCREEISLPANKAMGYDCEYPVFCDWFSVEKLQLVQRGVISREYDISIKNGVAKLFVKELKTDWSSYDDEKRREGVPYEPSKDSYETWYDLRALFNGGSYYLSEEDYFKLKEKTYVAKTRGILGYKYKKYTLRVPRTKNTYEQKEWYKNVKNGVDIQKFLGKFVECEIRDILGKTEIISVRELSKSESIHKKNFPPTRLRDFYQSNNLRWKYVWRDKLIDISKVGSQTLKFDFNEKTNELFISRDYDGNEISCKRPLVEDFSGGVNVVGIIPFEDKSSFRFKLRVRLPEQSSDYVVHIDGKEVWRYSKNIAKQ